MVEIKDRMLFNKTNQKEFEINGVALNAFSNLKKQLVFAFLGLALTLVGCSARPPLANSFSPTPQSQRDPYLDSVFALVAKQKERVPSSTPGDSFKIDSTVKELRVEMSSEDRFELWFRQDGRWLKNKTDSRLLIRDYIQPAIDALSKNGGGKIYFVSKNLKSFNFVEGDSEQVVLKSRVDLIGLNDHNGQKPIFSVEKKMGNIFFISQQENILVKNIKVLGHKKGNYVFSAFIPKNIRYEDIEIELPEATGFGHFAGQDVTYLRCKVRGDNPSKGHGFALGGNNGTSQDVNTQVIDSESHGFADPLGGQGLQFRAPLPSYGANPAMLNLNVVVQGGHYSNNLVGIWLQGVDFALVKNVDVHSNKMYGIYIDSVLESAELKPNRVQIENSNLKSNGTNQRPHAGVYANRANVTVRNSSFDGNLPHHILAAGSNLYFDFVDFYNKQGEQPYNIGFLETTNVKSYLKMHSGSLGPALFESIENRHSAQIVFE